MNCNCGYEVYIPKFCPECGTQLPMESEEIISKNNINRNNSSDILYTVKEVAKLIKTNPAFVYGLINRGLLPALKLGSLKIRRASLESFLIKYDGYDLNDLDNIDKLTFGTIVEGQK